MSKRSLNFIDLFAGAGGLSEGFVRTGFFPVCHIEMNHDAIETLKTREVFNFCKENNLLGTYNDYLAGRITKDDIRKIVPKDILNRVIEKEMSDENINELFKEINSLIEKFKIQKGIDVIIGGPPCQAYSLIGRSKNKRKEGDKRLYLYKIYAKFIKKYQPKMFVFENVPGILSCTSDGHSHFSDIQQCLKEVGYEIEYKILCAKDYGVLQNRKRLILIGWKKDSGWKYPNIEKTNLVATINDLLFDLPKIEPGECNNNYSTDRYRTYLSYSGIRNKNDVLTWHVSRPNRELDREIYRTAIKLWNKKQQRLNYNDLPDNLKTHKNRTSFVDRFKVVPGNLGFCQTIMAHISKDGHYFIHPDIKQARSISVREAARIQSFPDNYFFEGSRTSAYVQIGNAVPPLLAEAIAKGVKSLFDSKKKEQVNE